MSKSENIGLLKQSQITELATLKQSLGFFDAVALVVGIVVGVSIFETSALVAANMGNGITVLFTWLLGDAIYECWNFMLCRISNDVS